MARFTFRLEVLLEARRREERECQRILAEGRAVAVDIEPQIALLNEQLAESMQQVRAMHLSRRLDLPVLASHRRFVAALQRKGDALAQKLVAAQVKCEEARLRLGEG